MRKVIGKVDAIQKRWLNKQEAMKYLGCGERLLRTLREEGQIPPAQYKKTYWYDVNDLDRFLEKSKPFNI